MTTPGGNESFSSACGATGSLCLQVEHREDGTSSGRVLPQPFAVIGSEARADLVLQDADVRRRHAYLQVIDGRIFAIDLSRSAGHRSDRRHVIAGWVGTERAMKIGPFDVTPSLIARPGYVNGPQRPWQGNPLSSSYPGAQDPKLPEVTLVFLNKGDRAQPWRMDRVFALLGQSPDCKVQLIGSTVSIHHCSILRTAEGAWVVDLLGRKGISLNGRPVRFARLNNGDHLQVGEFLIGIECAPAASRIRAKLDSRSTVPAEQEGKLAIGRVATNGVAADSVPRQPAAASALHQTANPIALTNGHEPARDVAARMKINRKPAQRSAVPAGPVKRTARPPDTKRVSPPNSSGTPAEPLELKPLTSVTPEVIRQLDPATAMLFEQLGLMQQQMFEQFDRILTGMFQMLSSLHQDQAKAIRDEVNQIRELTRELYDLKAEQAKASVDGPSPGFRGPALDMPSLGRFASGPFAGHSGLSPAGVGAGTQVAEAPPPFVPPIRPTQPAAEPRQPVRASVQSGEDIHDLLTRRISELQDEQQGRLQKLFGLLNRR